MRIVVAVVVLACSGDALLAQLRPPPVIDVHNRVMFGSDQMVWPGVIERAIQVIESAAFLTEQQKRDVLYNNAARFLRLSDAEIARHHGR